MQNNYSYFQSVVVLLFGVLVAAFAEAQDITPPTLTISSNSVVAGSNGSFDFTFTFLATDDQGIQEIEYRGKVNGKPLESWHSYPYYENYPFPVSVDCSYFRLDVRAKDTSGNYSAIDSREFRAPFSNGGTIPVELLPPLTFIPNAELSVTPAVLVNGKNASIILRKIVLLQDRKKDSVSKSSIVYQVTYKNLTRKETTKITSKKNVISLKNLSAGKYNLSYKAQLREKDKVISSTKSSPAAKFNIS